MLTVTVATFTINIDNSTPEKRLITYKDGTTNVDIPTPTTETKGAGMYETTLTGREAGYTKDELAKSARDFYVNIKDQVRDKLDEQLHTKYLT